MHLTAIFKLRVSKRKRQILDHAMREYAQAQAWLLAWARPEVDHLAVKARVATAKGRIFYSARRIEALLPPIRECPADIHSSLRDAVRKNVSAMVAGYLSLREKGRDPGFPTARSERVGDFVAALERLSAAADVDEPSWQALMGDLARKAKLLPPALWFPRMDGAQYHRNAALLVDHETGKYFALLYLLPARHHLGQPLETRGNLVPLGIEDPQPWDSRSRAAIICPLEFGQWHEEKFLESGAAPKAARLYKNADGDYFLAVAFEMLRPEPVELSGAVLVVVASQSGLVAYAVVAPGGKVLDSGDYRPEATHLQALWDDWQREVVWRQRRGRSIEGFGLRRISKHTIHAVVNDLIDKAVSYGAPILVQGPGKAGKKWGGKRRRKRRPSSLGQIRTTLEYKAELAGLPKVKWAKMWQLRDGEWIHLERVCANCGYVVSHPKGKSMGAFLCPTCGEVDYGVNLAMSVAKAALGAN